MRLEKRRTSRNPSFNVTFCFTDLIWTDLDSKQNKEEQLSVPCIKIQFVPCRQQNLLFLMKTNYRIQCRRKVAFYSKKLMRHMNGPRAQNCVNIRCVRIVAENAFQLPFFCPFVRPSIRMSVVRFSLSINAASTTRISFTFDIGAVTKIW